MKLPPNYGPSYITQFAGVYPRLAKKCRIPLLPFLLEGVARTNSRPTTCIRSPQAQPHIMLNVMQELKPLLH